MARWARQHCSIRTLFISTDSCRDYVKMRVPRTNGAFRDEMPQVVDDVVGVKHGVKTLVESLTVTRIIVIQC